MLSIFSKLFEKLIHKRLLEFLIDNKIINPSQYGFRPGHSTQHALINATENIYTSLDLKLYTLGIFIDFSKAFDTVYHDILLHKLRHYGVHGSILNMIDSYLTNRYQYVSYGGTDSSKLLIKMGVPQGSVLGPLLFLIFINDLPNITNHDHVKFVLFADDSNMFINHSDRFTLFSIANEILQKLYDYCCANKIVINLDKCCYMEFGATSTDLPNYNLGILNHRFQKVEECKFLGVYLNSKLDWKSQIMHVKTQVSKATGALNSVKKIVPPKILRNIYFALIQPYLVYCAPLWGSIHTSKEYEDLFKVQKKAIRVISNLTYKVGNRFVNTKPLFYRHNILTVHNLYYYLLATASWKILNNKSPEIIFGYFNVSTRSIRLLLPKFNYHKPANKSFSFTASKLLNLLLQNDISYVGYTLQKFKCKLKRHLMFKQSLSLSNDPNWIPCNINIYSDISM